MPKNAAVFLDRDNTLIENDGDLGDPDHVKLFRGTASAVASLCGLGYKIVVVTNQAGVARGRFSEQDVQAVHKRINEMIKRTTGARIDRFYYCPHHPEASVERYRSDHAWRKPKPGMLLAAAIDLDLDLARCWMIGDQPRDVQAGQAASARTILLTRTRAAGSGARTTAPKDGQPDYLATSLVEAVKLIAQHRHGEVAAGDGQPARPEASRTSIANSAAGTQERSQRSGRQGRLPASGPNRSASEEVDRPDGRQVRPPDARLATIQRLLRQILQELRRPQRRGVDFSWVTMLAIVLQTLAAVCLLGAFWLGASEQNLFVRWLGSATLVQLATITLLLFRRAR